MASIFTPSFPATGPWYIDREDCIGDSLSYLNANTNYLAATIEQINNLIVNSIAPNIVPAGAVQAFVQSSPPTGWIACEGVIVPNGPGTVATTHGNVTTNFTALYAAVGLKFGAAGQLPDLRGYFIRGHGINSDGIDSTGNLGRKQNDAFKSHNHGGITGNDSPDHSHGGVMRYPGTMVEQNQSGGPDGPRSNFDQNTGGASVRHAHSIPSQGDLIETRPKNISLLYCIKY
jgi:microcystin-dependent protein